MATAGTALSFPISTDDVWALRLRSFPIGAAANLNTTNVLFVTEEEIDIEQIIISAETALASGTNRFWWAPSGTALASGTAITAADDFITAANSAVKLPLSAGATRIPAGSKVGLVGSANATGTGVNVTIVTRKGGYTTNDAGNKNYTSYGNPPAV